MSRKVAREYAYKLVFEYNFWKKFSEFSLENVFADPTLTKDDRNYINTVYSGVIDKFDGLCETIQKYSTNFQLNRIYKADLSVLLLAIYEMKYMDDIPLTVSISEAIEIVKKFSTPKSNVFVNGVLSSVYKEINQKS